VNGPILGWDIGGANIKAALVDGSLESQPIVLERPFALWREPERLAAVLADVAAQLPPARAMAITMTAELADCFATKREGVAFVLDAVSAAFPDADTQIYGVDGRFRSIDEARSAPLLIAAANWMATATLVAQETGDAILVDIGSTTTDITPIVAGQVVAAGRTDPDRLCRGELVYTGALRTPVCAIVSSVPLRGKRCRVAAEHFAIAADVHLWRGDLDERDYTCETADGRGRTRHDAAARIARMVCADLDMITDDDVSAIAEQVAAAQVRHIADGIRQVVERLGSDAPRLGMLAGRGAFLGRAALGALALEIGDLADRVGAAAACAAPAAAVARLLAQTRTAV
jgi:(4-(4-[2-(gamma-L-glutamylamino)ethyl]phenoxymethyl)furan-2-yl)methanamine synthase